MRYAVLDTAAPGVVSSSMLSTGTSAALEVNAVRVGTRAFVAWRAAASSGDDRAEDLMLREATWTSGTLTFGEVSIAAPREAAHRVADQRLLGLAGSGSLLQIAWDDYSQSLHPSSFRPDVVVERIPLPILRVDAGGD